MAAMIAITSPKAYGVSDRGSLTFMPYSPEISDRGSRMVDIMVRTRMTRLVWWLVRES